MQIHLLRFIKEIMMGLNLFIIIILLLATAIFVMAEFAFVKVRTSRIDQLVQEGHRQAVAAQHTTQNLDGYLSASQLGITITALGLGWLGEPTVDHLLYPLFMHLHLPVQATTTISFIFSFAVVTFFHVVLGELVPKTIALQKAEALTLKLAAPMILFYRIMYPFIWLLNGSANLVIRLFGFKPAKEHEEAHSEAELRIILTESFKSGEINQAEYGYVSKIFEFDELKAREVMVPRTDMVCLYVEKSLKENVKIIKEEQYTRFPIAKDNKDNIIGIINTKQFFLQFTDNPNLELLDMIHPVLSVSESTPIKKLLKEMQKQHSHIAILVDEYGGTAGMITIEDILEEIVGEIQDEFDQEERPEIEVLNENHVIVDGKVLVSEINDIFRSGLDQDEFDTIGGWLFAQNPLLKEGDQCTYENITFTVKKRDRHRYRKVEIMLI